MLCSEAQERHTVGLLLLGRGLLVAAREEFRQWLALVEGSNDPQQIIPALNALAAVAHRRREMEEALGFMGRALALTQDPSISDGLRLRVHLNLMTVHMEIGQLDAALDHAKQAAVLEARAEPTLSRAYWLNLSMLYWRRQEWVPMRRASRQAYTRGIATGDGMAAAKALTNMGIAHLGLGALNLAERDLTTALSKFEEFDSAEVAYVHAELGKLYLQRGDHQAAMESGRKALQALLTGTGVLDKEEVARVSRLFGIIFSTSGQRNLTLKYLNRAAAYFSQIGLRAEWQRSTELIGQFLSGPVSPGRRQLMEEVQRLDLLTAVLDLTDDLESVDPYLRGHSERVASLAVLLGEDLGIAGEELQTLNHAARLHDVGMIAVDIDLLQRVGPLTEAERNRVSMHSVIGEEMLRPYGLPSAGLKAVRHHHERWDGQGIPDGLAGDAIPRLARIVRVAEIYDALTSDRVYRKAMSHASALDELAAMAGRELDPDLVDRFIGMHKV